MYAGFFGFRELPFNNTPDPRFFYSTPDHEEALASLIYAVQERKGFVLLTGEVGAGKTLVTRMMLRHFGTRLAFATINHAMQSLEDLMESICTEFELPVRSGMSATELVRVFHDFLLARFAQNTPVVLVLDEAQNLRVERFEQLRTIGNLEADDAKLLQVAIVGQPELQDMFLSPELCQLRQRIFRSFHLPALSREDTEGYIRHRLSVVTESQVDIFEKGAIEAICSFSGGLPRIINTVCDNALLSAYSADRPTIAGDFIESVIAQMMIVGDTHRGASDTPEDRAVRSPRPVSISPTDRRAPPEPVRERRRNRVETRLPTETLLGRMDGTVQRMQRIETLVRDQPSAQEVIERAESTSQHEEKTRIIQLELARLERKVHCKSDETNRRHDESERRLGTLERCLGALEQRLGDAIGELSEARTIHATLGSVAEQSQSMVRRGEEASHQMDQRHRELREVAGTVNHVVRDLRRVLSRAHEAATKTGRAESRALTIHKKLLSQSKRSSRIAEELGRMVERGLAAGSTSSPHIPGVRLPAGKPGMVGASAEKEVPVMIDPPRGAQAVGPALPTDAMRKEEELQSARQDHVHSHDSASAANNGGTPSANDRAELATNRLARRVDNLLELIQTSTNQTG